MKDFCLLLSSVPKVKGGESRQVFMVGDQHHVTSE